MFVRESAPSPLGRPSRRAVPIQTASSSRPRATETPLPTEIEIPSLGRINIDPIVGHIVFVGTDRLLGRGSFGSTFKTRINVNGSGKPGKPVATKVILKKSWRTWPDVQAQALQEIAVLRLIQQQNGGEGHENIASFIHGGGGDDKPIYLTTQLARNGNLYQWLVAMRSSRQHLDEYALWGIPFQVATALLFMLALGYIHRDIKPENLGVDGLDRSGQPRILLLDFGSACKIDDVQALMIPAGSGPYMAPELRDPDEATSSSLAAKGDVWSLAFVLLWMFSVPFPDEPFDIKKVWKPQPELWEHAFGFQEGKVTLLRRMLQLDAADRCPLEDVETAARLFSQAVAPEESAEQHVDQPIEKPIEQTVKKTPKKTTKKTTKRSVQAPIAAVPIEKSIKKTSSKRKAEVEGNAPAKKAKAAASPKAKVTAKNAKTVKSKAEGKKALVTSTE